MLASKLKQGYLYLLLLLFRPNPFTTPLFYFIIMSSMVLFINLTLIMIITMFRYNRSFIPLNILIKASKPF